MRSSTFLGAVCAGLLGLYIGVSHIGGPISVPTDRIAVGPATSGLGPTTSVPRLNPPVAVGRPTVEAPSKQSIGAGTPAPVITTTEPTSAQTVTAETVSVTKVAPMSVSPKPKAPKPVAEPVAHKPPPENPPAPKPVVQPPDEPVPPTVAPPPPVPPKDGIDDGHEVDVDAGHESCHHGDNQKDDEGHDGYDSPDGSSHRDGGSDSAGYDHGPKQDGSHHDDPAEAATEHSNDAPTSALGVVSNTLVGSAEGG
jgi:hypothetical protein